MAFLPYSNFSSGGGSSTYALPSTVDVGNTDWKTEYIGGKKIQSKLV